ncbi:hypothetical protein [Streptococcus pneumoniae]|nr:hypothetical protein [Streptococcus pneumoniae]SND56898.1 Tn5252, relaxase [Streptococcus pneumoniae]SNF69681.1 Tn5252, relaxase [Streptococcus pneumoniae]SNF78178.1 Tn5252, relaxase [Streptococcus pneumoniae]SNG93273.1 Tn5252, relaxase [Streptococcus pneumoniae]SNI57049.1 Tn5252, relaxase [Streptococcus pneumoniae]
MVVTKHFATHGKKYRRRLIKYILNPDKTDNLTPIIHPKSKNHPESLP